MCFENVLLIVLSGEGWRLLSCLGVLPSCLGVPLSCLEDTLSCPVLSWEYPCPVWGGVPLSCLGVPLDRTRDRTKGYPPPVNRQTNWKRRTRAVNIRSIQKGRWLPRPGQLIAIRLKTHFRDTNKWIQKGKETHWLRDICPQLWKPETSRKRRKRTLVLNTVPNTRGSIYRNPVVRKKSVLIVKDS